MRERVASAAAWLARGVDADDVVALCGLACLGAGVWSQYSRGAALIVVGAALLAFVAVNVVLKVWLASRTAGRRS